MKKCLVVLFTIYFINPLYSIDFEELMNFYKNGYSCNKCGNHFIAYFEADHPLKKPSIMVRFFKLMIYIILFSAFFWLVFS